ncbi:MAG: AAA family ATPase, partial [Muribaculaceae bacterium]|nr:AAA family ATPase [Muribaculaceae bacterium]
MTALTDILNRNPVLRFAEAMRQTPQPEQWHGEGDVLTHTRMVIRSLDELPEVAALSRHEREVLYAAAWLHDIGKIRQTREIAGRIEAPGHSSAGSRMAREELWLKHGLCGDFKSMQLREAISLIVRYHSVPPHAIDSDAAQRTLHRIAANSLLTPYFSVKLLCLLSRADMMGRICNDREAMLDQVALCEELAKEEGCYETCYPFPSDYTRRAYLDGRDVWKNQQLHDDSWGTVYMMSGLPGTGKDTLIRHNLPDIPMVSLDEIRRKRRIPPTDNQGFVANLAKEQAKEYMRKHQPFVWNATNLTSAMRQQLVSLFESYKASVNIIY